MLRGACPKCGLTRYGWALRNERYQLCRECGTRLEIKEINDNYLCELHNRDDELKALKSDPNDEEETSNRT